MYRKQAWIAAGGLCAALLAGCSGGKAPTGGTAAPGPWDYPSSDKFALTLYSDRTSVAEGDSFDVKVVFYNVPSLFGAAFEIGYTGARAGAGRFIGNGAYLSSGGTVLSLNRVEPDSSKASAAFTHVRGGGTFDDNGVIVKLRCKALRAGIARFTVRDSTLRMVKSDGTAIDGFASLRNEGLAITIR